MKENRRIVTRFDKLAKSYAAMVSLACAMRCLRHLFSYRAYSGHFMADLDNAQHASLAHGRWLVDQKLDQPH
ncbi:hypothetical protein Q6A49_20430 [Pseudomonas sp. 22-AL-CL-001]|uniref:hypothetical protein n=1 Tax=Pseudomonas alabamensis TaxID=3064349 RepID=UPI0027129070|nr:hypothetical protein [Pseudomonas sp. 22-AL-CL-001]MDO7912898.1 hypothetical protein [Pseudomonas sp. 22-AL-CL-001]